MIEKLVKGKEVGPSNEMWWYDEADKVSKNCAAVVNDDYSPISPEDVIAVALRDAYLFGTKNL